MFYIRLGTGPATIFFFFFCFPKESNYLCGERVRLIRRLGNDSNPGSVHVVKGQGHSLNFPLKKINVMFFVVISTTYIYILLFIF